MKENPYKPLKVELNEVAGVQWAIKAMRLPKGTEGDSQYNFTTLYGIAQGFIIGPRDTHLASSLVKAGNDHAKAMRGVIAYLSLELQVGFMIEFETYRIGAEVLSTSSAMHGELKTLHGEELANQKQRDLVDKVYKRDIMFSYQALRSIYRARRHHKHPDWQIFCSFIETLPYFDILIFPEREEKPTVH